MVDWCDFWQQLSHAFTRLERMGMLAFTHQQIFQMFFSLKFLISPTVQNVQKLQQVLKDKSAIGSNLKQNNTLK
jgi:hypothetical protein